MANIGFIVYGDIRKVTGGNYYDQMLIRALEARGHTVRVTDPANVKADLAHGTVPPAIGAYIVDELCHPDFSSKKDFALFGDNYILIAMAHHLAAEERLGPAQRLRHFIQERGFFCRIDYCICNSAATESAVRRIAGYRGPAGIAVPGVPRVGEAKAGTERYNVPARPEARRKGKVLKTGSPLRLLALGNVIPRKGIHYVLESMAIEPRLPCLLEVAGSLDADPGYTKKLRKLTANLGLQDGVEFLGFIPEEEKRLRLTASDLLVVPSDHEGYGIVYLEAMEFGTVPVGSNSGGAVEIIRHGHNGFLVPPRSPRSLYEIFSFCLREPEGYNKISGNARRTWEAHPDWKATFGLVIRDLERLTKATD